jgi:hypothetical protein
VGFLRSDMTRVYHNLYGEGILTTRYRVLMVTLASNLPPPVVGRCVLVGEADILEVSPLAPDEDVQAVFAPAPPPPEAPDWIAQLDCGRFVEGVSASPPTVGTLLRCPAGRVQESGLRTESAVEMVYRPSPLAVVAFQRRHRRKKRHEPVEP